MIIVQVTLVVAPRIVCPLRWAVTALCMAMPMESAIVIKVILSDSLIVHSGRSVAVVCCSSQTLLLYLIAPFGESHKRLINTM